LWRNKRKGLLAAGALAGAVAGCALALWVSDMPPPRLDRFLNSASVVVDRQGEVLRAFPARDGAWRFVVSPDEVDSGYLGMLLSFEDKAFYQHRGVSPRALLRAALTSLWHGRIVSGGSTLTMQVARLLEPRPRGILAKLHDIVQALRLEQAYDKKTLLAFYLTLAPEGGNLEGVRAGSLAWFGHGPERLTPAESALLVAIPQSPARLRPDRAGRTRLLQARAKVLSATGSDLSWANAPLPEVRHDFPMLAPHLSEQLHGQHSAPVVHTTLDAGMQRRVMRLLDKHMAFLPSGLSAAVMVVDAASGDVRVHAGSPDYFSVARSGMMDMTRAVRSPGSVLKPFIYALAADRLLVHPDTVLRDSAHDFGGYAPRNFDDGFHGSVSMRQALQHSYNIPAVMVLERLGPLTFDAALRDAGVSLVFDRSRHPPLLPLALGGVGSRMLDMMVLYGALARGGETVSLRLQPEDPVRERPFVGREAAQVINGILRGTPRPENVPAHALPTLAYKTGTSYGYRDAWAFGHVGGHVIGVWFGYPDSRPCAECTGFGLAAPLLAEIAQALPPLPLDLPAFVPGLLSLPVEALPALLREFGRPALLDAGPVDSLELVFPKSGSLLQAGEAIPLLARGGTPPHVFLVEGVPQKPASPRSQPAWMPEGTGFFHVSVMDAAGRSVQAEVFVGDGALVDP